MVPRAPRILLAGLLAWFACGHVDLTPPWKQIVSAGDDGGGIDSPAISGHGSAGGPVGGTGGGQTCLLGAPDTNAGKIATSSGSIPGNLWKHVAVTLAAGAATVYIDGTSVGTRTSVLSPKDIGTVDYAFIGRSQFANDPYLDGLIDEFWVYDRALSGAEVNALYAAAAP
jgi:hypothetical protein